MTDQSTHIAIDQVNKAFGKGENRDPVLNSINLEIGRGEFVTLFGPNGCGKSTLLNLISGIDSIDEGEIRIVSEQSQPRVGYVFQDYRGNLMPWLTVAQNIAFPLKIRGVPESEQMERVHALLERYQFKLDLDAYTYTLSGGQAQLASILRALIIDPEILLMDEPFSALDYQTNLGLYEKLLHIWKTEKVTTLLVSHDVDEALYLGERTVFFTKRPATVTAILDNKLSGKKDLSQFGTDEFAALKRKALDIFKHEAFEVF